MHAALRLHLSFVVEVLWVLTRMFLVIGDFEKYMQEVNRKMQNVNKHMQRVKNDRRNSGGRLWQKV